MKTWHGRAVILSLASALLFACAPTPLVPSGKSRIPVNSEEVISQYRERVKVDQRDRVERNGLARQVDALTKQIQELKAYVTLLQLQQQESEKGSVRQVQKVGAGSPPSLSRAPERATRKDKQAPEAQAKPPIAAVPSEVAAPPMIPIAEIPTDLCGQKIRDASAYGWVDPTSNALTHGAGLGAEHGQCRHIASSAAPSAGQ
jgi:TolA-binding protein